MIDGRLMWVVVFAFISIFFADAAYGAWYAGADLSFMKRKISLGSPYNKDVDEIHSGGGVALGALLHRNLGVEISYRYLGTVSERSPSCPPGLRCGAIIGPNTLYQVSISTYSLSLVPRLPLNEHISLYGKAGASFYDVSAKGAVVNMADSSFSYGVGMEFGLKGPLFLRIEYDKLSSDIRGVSMGVAYSPD